MNTITHSQRYLPHEINTKFYAVKLYRTGVGVSFVCRRYHISKSSLLRWNKKFNGTKESLLDKSHRPLSKHPNSHTDEELKWIRDYHRRNPKISVCELYGKLRTNKGYSRHPGSLYRIYRKLGYSSYAASTKKMDYQHFFRQIFLGYFFEIVQAFDTLRKNVCGDDYTNLHNPIVLSSVPPVYGIFHSIQILF